MPIDWLPLCGTVLTLGVRHGLDADHLAAIDGLTRYNSEARPSLARWCGALFSLGHGGVVVLVAGFLGSAASAYTVPEWMQGFGAWVSIVCLIGLGCVNLWTVLRTPVDELVQLAGLRGTLLAQMTRTCQPLGIVALGSLFAVSFDTLGQAVLFSATAAHAGGVFGGIALGGLFMLGMMLVDGVNGAWVAQLLRARDHRARVASRAIGLLVTFLSFAVAGLGVFRYFSRDVDMAIGTRETVVGILLAAAVVVGIVILGNVGAENAGQGCQGNPDYLTTRRGSDT